jgi:hypothetical protein
LPAHPARAHPASATAINFDTRTTVSWQPWQPRQRGQAARSSAGEAMGSAREGLAARRFGWSTLLIDLLGGADGGARAPSDDPFVGSLRDELRSMGAEAAGEAARRLNRRAAAAAAAARRLRPG